MNTLGTTHPYFIIEVTAEQQAYAKSLVEYSIANHPVKDIFADDPDGKRRQFEFRYTGTLGEVVFADAYRLQRPTRSFGAVDGQDFGQDFLLDFDGTPVSIDVKSMHRKANQFMENYVLNIPAYQLHKSVSLTNYYFCINLNEYLGKTFASFLGLVDKKDVIDGKVGDLFLAGTQRIRQDNTTFRFARDTYEIMFRHFIVPPVTPHIQAMPGFRHALLVPGRPDNRY